MQTAKLHVAVSCCAGHGLSHGRWQLSHRSAPTRQLLDHASRHRKFRRSSVDTGGPRCSAGLKLPSLDDIASSKYAKDSDKEKSREYRRTVFDFELWRRHRSTNRFARHIAGLFGSRMLRGLDGPLVYTGAISLFIGVYETARAQGQLPAGFGSLAVSTTEPFALTSFALSLLLVFRTNSSYARWWEARKIWGGVTNRTRDFVRQGVTWFDESDEELVEALKRWTIAFPYTLMAHLREDHDLAADLQGVLEAHELEALLRSGHRPNAVLQVLSNIVTGAEMVQMRHARMDENLTFFADCLGKCERILRTPIPLSYTRHTSRFMVIWLTFMPFTLWHSCHWATLPASVVIAFLLLGIEELGVQIEEPFGILPLERMSTNIDGNLRGMVAERDLLNNMLCESLGTTTDILAVRQKRKDGDLELNGHRPSTSSEQLV